MARSPAPTGTVTVSSGNYTSAPVTIVAGSASIAIPAGSLSFGTNILTAAFTPDANSASLYAAASATTEIQVKFLQSSTGRLDVSIVLARS